MIFTYDSVSELDIHSVGEEATLFLIEVKEHRDYMNKL